MMLRAPWASGVIGFSQKTRLPASMQAMTSASWAGPNEQIITASTSGSAMSSALSVYPLTPYVLATVLTLSSAMSEIATTSPPAITLRMRSMWACPMPPGPIMPMRTVM